MQQFTWLFKMAWRDAKRNKSRLLLFSLSIITGIAALVAIRSFSINLQNEIQKQAKDILGADLVISGTQPLSVAGIRLIDSIGSPVSKEISFTSMVLFLKSGKSRLCQVRGVENNYPFYGAVETLPSGGLNKIFKSPIPAAFPEELLSIQFGLAENDSIKIGDLTFICSGSVTRIPGQAGIFGAVAPVIFIPYATINATQLLQKGSRVNYKFYYKFPRGRNTEKLVAKIKPTLDKEHLRAETVKITQERTSEAYANLGQYLNLVAFIALLLGCIGVSSAVQIYIKEKIPSVAILRCLGTTSNQAFLIYLIQVLFLGISGAIAGAFIGELLQLVLPRIFKEFLTIEVEAGLSIPAMLEGIAAGTIVALLFGLLPLLQIRNVSPLSALRAAYAETSARVNTATILVYSLIILFITSFAYLQIGSFYSAAIFTICLVGAFIFLIIIAIVLMRILKAIDLSESGFIFKQGIANLFRPDNQTVVMTLCIGLGIALISMLFLVQNILLNKVTLEDNAKQPNMILFDIQPSQKDKIFDFTLQQSLPVLQKVPIVTMRLESIKGKSKTKLEKDATANLPSWIFNREYRVTFRDSLTASEAMVAGQLYHSSKNNSDTVLISVEEGFAKTIHAKLGDALTFNVQGALLPVKIGSFRKVDWKRIQTNFILLFPTGVLESAPTFYVFSTRTPSKEKAALYQSQLIKNFPNVSVIDLTQVLITLKEVLAKISFVIRFMALFSIFTGIIVIIGSVRMSKYQRIKESVLLRTLGAGRNQILGINMTEYFILGLVGVTSGNIFSLIASWAFSVFILESPFVIDWLPLLLLELFVPAGVMLLGLFNVGNILRKPPLEILRNEVA